MSHITSTRGVQMSEKTPTTEATTDPTTRTELIAEDLIEEISIDGMCGVY